MQNDQDNDNQQNLEPTSQLINTEISSSLSLVQDNNNAAANLIRTKLNALYNEEPDAEQELLEAKQTPRHSKHQQFMLSLSTSGKSLAEIQQSWHEYYAALSNEEKHRVWQEFYDEHAKTQQSRVDLSRYQINLQPKVNSKPIAPLQNLEQGRVDNQLPNETNIKTLPIVSAPKVESMNILAEQSTSENINPDINNNFPEQTKLPGNNLKNVSQIKNQILKKVELRSRAKKPKLKLSGHLKSLGFGAGIGGLFLLIMLFGLFNEQVITPFITPSSVIAATPIIVDPTTNQTVPPEPKVIIPKINIEAPVVYDSNSNSETEIQKLLQTGTYHYVTTAKPGEKGNVIIFGHSSNNLFNPGKFKFVFLALNKVEVGDQFMLNYNGTRYTYRVFNKRIVNPSQVDVLSASPRPNMATLITCDPPGTSQTRLLVEAEQISPDSVKNNESTASKATPLLTIPGNAPSLWSKIYHWFF